MIRILIVDDSLRNRMWVRKLLASQSDWEVCGEAVDGQQAIDRAASLQPHVIILDIQMPVMNGFDAARQILRAAPSILILILSLHHDSDYEQLAKDCGARGLLAKDEAEESLVPVISAVLRGELYFSNIPAN